MNAVERKYLAGGGRDASSDDGGKPTGTVTDRLVVVVIVGNSGKNYEKKSRISDDMFSRITVAVAVVTRGGRGGSVEPSWLRADGRQNVRW